MTILVGLAAAMLLVWLFVVKRPTHPELPAADQLPGGDPSRAIVVASPAVIDRHAERWPCPVCQGSVRCETHGAELIAGKRLRVARVRCPRCGFERDVYFALRGA
ncbi:hypothetical protein DB30_06256 [Enhygromyxa salina]|uniref:Uncharacterized protein n=1 Tax=Enhygromyxa salina TaxID=215803 RepID=A0A0C1ZB37_9BACT|nr:hypothetical protein [Enhygromyxa salina]KIG14874.1 hypothetical protein DB30_06256 [Enhygromyxa salina]